MFELVPVPSILVFDIEILVFGDMGWALDLDITAGPKRYRFALWQLDNQFLDKGCDVAVAVNLALPLANLEDLGWQLDLHVALDLHLTRKPHAFSLLTSVDMADLGWKHRATALADGHRADTTAAFAAAGRGDKDFVGRKSSQKGATGIGDQGLVRVVVDDDADVASGYELATGNHQKRHQHHDDEGEHEDA